MSYIGQKPTDKPLSASDLEDGLITNSKLAQDIISAETELATAPASTDEFLISDAGTLKRIDASLVGSADFVKIAESSSLGASTIDYNSSLITSDYKTIQINFNNLSCANDNEDIYLQLSSDNGSNFAGITQTRGYIRIDQSSNSTMSFNSYDGGGMDHDYHILGQDMEATASGGGFSGTAWIYGISDTTAKKYVLSLTSAQNGNQGYYMYYNGSVHDTTSAINLIRVLNGSGNNIDSGTIQVFGYK